MKRQLTIDEAVEITYRNKILMGILERLSLSLNGNGNPYFYTAIGKMNKPSNYYQRFKRMKQRTTTTTERVVG